jgi:hypothetical protein
MYSLRQADASELPAVMHNTKMVVAERKTWNALVRKSRSEPKVEQLL